jgi:hypothetical protein
VLLSEQWWPYLDSIDYLSLLFWDGNFPFENGSRYWLSFFFFSPGFRDSLGFRNITSGHCEESVFEFVLKTDTNFYGPASHDCSRFLSLDWLETA